jgi:hypothetical protein
MAEELAALPPETGGPMLAEAVRTMNEIILAARKYRLTKQQYVMFLLADMMTWCEVGDAFSHKAALYAGDHFLSTPAMKAAARFFARGALEKVYVNGLKIVYGCQGDVQEPKERLHNLNMAGAMAQNLQDMELVVADLVK